MVKIDAELDLETVMWREARRLVAVDNFDRPQNANKFFRDRLRFDARRLQQEYEWASAAIHNWHFARGYVDVQIIDAETGERRH